MGSVKEEITRLETAKKDIETAIETCGVNVPDTELIDTYASYIRQIPSAVFSGLNVDPVGGADQFIQSIKQTNGLIEATVGGLVSTSSSGLVPKADGSAGVINSPSDDYVLTYKGGTIDWYKLPANAFKNDNNNTTYTLSGALNGNAYDVTLTPSSGSATGAKVPAMGAASSSAAGTAGLVPAPAKNQHNSFLRGDGTWVVPDNTTYSVMTGATASAAGKSGLVPQPAKGDQGKFLSGAGTWTSLPSLSITDSESGNAVTDVEVSGHGITLKRGTTFSVNGHKHSSDDITALTNYIKATTASAIASTDSLNSALGKLEYKADLGKTAYDIVNAANDGDGTIENLKEILKVLEGISDTDTIQAIIGKYLPLEGGTMTGNILLGGGNAIIGSGNSIPAKFKDSVSISPEVHSLWLAAVGTGSNNTAGSEASGILFDGNTIKMWSPLDNAPQIIDSDNGTAYNLLHSGNSSVSKSGQTLTVKINGVEQSITNSTYSTLPNPYNISFKDTSNNTVTYNGSSALDLTGGVYYAVTSNTATAMSSFSEASNEATWRYVWMSWNDNSGKPAYSNKLKFQTSTGTLSATTFSGNLSGHATSARYISCPDTRSTAITPKDLTADPTGVSFDFKRNSITGLTAAFAGVMTFRPYSSSSDWSGGPAHNLAFDANGLHHRTSKDNTTWNSWKKLAYTSDIPTKTSQLTNDSGYITSYVDTAAGKTFKNLSSISHSGWTNNTTDDKIIPTMSFIAYWNGAYSSTGASNLLYCANGTIIGSSNIGSQSVNYANSAGNADTVDNKHASGFAYSISTGANFDCNTTGTHPTTYRLGNTPANAFSNASRSNLLVIGGGDTMTQIGCPYNSDALYFRRGTWYADGTGSIKNNAWKSIIHEGNFNSYAPKLDGTGATGTWGINITGSATAASYSRSLLGRNTSGTDYSAVAGNLIFAEWNTQGDNRWYLKAEGYETRVGYASDSDKLDGIDSSGFLKYVTQNATFSSVANISTDLVPGIHSIHIGGVEYSSILTGKDFKGSYWQLYFHPSSGYTQDIKYRATNCTTWKTLLDSNNWSSFITIPSVGNGTVTINQAGASKGSFTLNQSTAATIDLTDTNYYPTAFSWTGGTTAGPTGSLTGTGMSPVSFGAIPSASASASGIVTTAAQSFAGVKTFTGKVELIGGGSGSMSITYDKAALVIGTMSRTGTTDEYYPGIAFNHMYGYGGGSSYRNHAHAWIGLRLESTPGSELSSLIFATQSTTTTGTALTERMCITSEGTVGIGAISPNTAYKLYVNGHIYGSKLYSPYIQDIHTNYLPFLVGRVYKAPGDSAAHVRSGMTGLTISQSKNRIGRYVMTITNNTGKTVYIHTPMVIPVFGNWGSGACYESPFAYLDHNYTYIFPMSIATGETLQFAVICGKIHTQSSWSSGDFTKSNDDGGFSVCVYGSWYY